MTGNGSRYLTEGGSQEVESVSSGKDCMVQVETSICCLVGFVFVVCVVCRCVCLFVFKKKALKNSVDVCMMGYMNSVCKWAVAFPVWILHSESNQQWNLVV